MYLLKAGLVTTIGSGGLSYQIADKTMGIRGGLIINPLNPKDQGLGTSESLWVNLLGSAITSAVNGSTEIVPGQAFLTPPGVNVYVTAASSGHKFSAFFTTEYVVPFPPDPVPPTPGGGGGGAVGGRFAGQPFPPLTVTGLTNVIPSYLYQEYSDDDDLQGFVEAQNECQQDYVDTFNALNLPIYTGRPSLVSGKLLDWVGTGLYGMNRPALSSGRPLTMGPLNTWGCNWLFPMWGLPPANVQVKFGLNEMQLLSVGDIVITDDDLYRRILTWHLFKGDGNYYNVRKMKRKIWRFLYGVDGQTLDYAWDPALGAEHVPGEADPDDAFIANTEQISISIGVHRNVTIRFVLGHRTVTGGLLNQWGPNGFQLELGVPYPMIGEIQLNDIDSTYTPYPPLPYMSTFKTALDSGVLEVPYQFNYTCTIG